MTEAPVLFGIQPTPDLVGWCHHCERWQRGSAARVVVMRRGEDFGFLFVCTRCDDEPWGVGIWTCSCASCDPEEPRDMACWQDTRAACADARCVDYVGPLGCDHRATA